MFPFLEKQPVFRFFVEVFAMVAGAAVVVLLAGWQLHWSRRTEYSDGFFYACVALAAVSSSLAVLFRQPYPTRNSQVQSAYHQEENQSGLAGFFARRSFNFRMLFAALICLVLSILIAQ